MSLEDRLSTQANVGIMFARLHRTNAMDLIEESCAGVNERSQVLANTALEYANRATLALKKAPQVPPDLAASVRPSSNDKNVISDIAES